MPYDENEQLQQQIEAAKKQAGRDIENMTKTLGIVESVGGQMTFLPLTEFYRKTLSAAVLDIASGAFDYNSVLKRTVNTLANSGIRTIDYTSGYTSRLPVAARRAVMTAVSKMAGEISEMNAEKLGTEYFEVTYHSGARPSHRKWQGRVYSKRDLVRVCGLGDKTGLKGINCYHDYYPFIPGVSKRQYSDKWLREQEKLEKKKKTFKGKEYTPYDAKQKQRRMETSMRAQRQKVRLLEEGGADPDDIIIAKARYQGQLQEYKQFSNAMGLKAQMERVYIDGLGRVASGGKIQINRSAKVSKRGIINQRDYDVPKGLGAAAKRYDVRLLQGGNASIKEGSKITKIKTFAGKGTDKEIRDRFDLEAQYGHPADSWQKNRGEAVVVHKGKERKAEIHWYEAEGEKVRMKVKRYFDEG